MKSIPNWKGEMDVCYQEKDLNTADILGTVQLAKAMWTRLCSDYVARNGDVGTCVLGAGIFVNYVAPRARSRSRKMLISASSVSGSAQGASVWEHSVKEVLQYLRDRGVQAEYFAGSMD